MTSLLDDTKQMLELQYGDIARLQHIKETLEQNKMLNISDRKYLCKLMQEKSSKPTQTSKYYFEETIRKAQNSGFKIIERPKVFLSKTALLKKN